MTPAVTAFYTSSRGRNGHAPRARFCALLLTGLSLSLSLGCRAKPSEFRIVDYDDSGRAAIYAERFDEAYYRVDEHDNVDIVLLSEQQSAPDSGGRTTTQIIALHSVWRAIPGRTVAASSQINATVIYVIGDDDRWAIFGGAGSIFFKEDRKHGVLTGKLEHAFLTPQERPSLLATGSTGSAGSALFTRAIISGKFRALRDPQRVHQLLSQTKLLYKQIATP